MKYLRCGLTLVFSLLLAAAAQAQTEQGNLRVIVRPDGLIIRYNDQARRDALKPGGAVRMAQDVINELERQCSGCYHVGRDQLAVQLFGHAAGYYAPSEWIQRHAREANLTWGQLKNPFSRDFYRGAIRAPGRGQSPYAQSQLRGAQDRERAARDNMQRSLDTMRDNRRAIERAVQSGRSADIGARVREYNRSLDNYVERVREASRARREAADRNGGNDRSPRESHPSRDSGSSDRHSWQDRQREWADRKP